MVALMNDILLISLTLYTITKRKLSHAELLSHQGRLVKYWYF